MLIELNHPELTMGRQCELLGLSRSSWHYRPRKDDEADAFNDRLMGLIDRQFMMTPFYGVERMTVHLRRLGHAVNVKRVRRLMRLMGLEAIYPKPRTTINHPENKVYPYLLRGLTIDHRDQVWATDITYIPMRRGWMYLVG